VRRLVGLLRNRNFLLVSSILLGLLLGDAARPAQPLIMPGLVAAMTVSVLQVSAKALADWRLATRAVLLSLLLSYGLLGGLTLLLARWLLPDAALWPGFVLAAAVPCGIAVLPFSYILGGDPAFALLGLLGVYMASLVLTPLLALWLIGPDVVSPLRLVTILVQLIAVPLLLSRLIVASPWKGTVERWRGAVVNWAFALLMFAIIGVNRDLMLRQPGFLLLCAVIGVVGNFGLCLLLDAILTRLRVARPRRMTLILMGTIKNTSLAGAVALSLFGERASLPTAVISATNVLYMVWLGMRWGRE
jgi:BASS family bile acid:Na+ symporter